jgi:hypothetical protein
MARSKPNKLKSPHKQQIEEQNNKDKTQNTKHTTQNTTNIQNYQESNQNRRTIDQEQYNA